MKPHRTTRLSTALLALAAGGFAGSAAFGFENAKVLPKGVRSVNIRTVSTDIEQKTDGAGVAHPLGEPLAQKLTFDRIAKGEEEMKARQLRAFLSENGFAEDEAVGQFTSDLRGHVNVVAPIVSYGVSDRLTLAVAAPVYDARTSVAVGFEPTATASAFLSALARPENNQALAAREAGTKLNEAVARLNTKLLDNGYAALDDWHAQGMGDMTVAGKYRHVGGQVLGVASTTGFVAPTGRTDDPEILTDVAFGDGQWDLFGQVAVDETVGGDVVFNQFVKYTVQLPGDRNVRAVTADEKIEVPYTESRYKLGDKVDGGASVQWQPAFGLLAGVGYSAYRKYGDLYREVNGETRAVLESGTDQSAQNALGLLGYSTVPLYQRGVFAVPFEMKLSYTRQLRSTNMPVSDLAQFDLSLFF